jgi:hypothetical protein
LCYFLLACHHDVINISENISLHLAFEDGLRHPTERGAGILEAFGHPKVTIVVEGRNEACFLFILFLEPDLMVSGEII